MFRYLLSYRSRIDSPGISPRRRGDCRKRLLCQLAAAMLLCGGTGRLTAGPVSVNFSYTFGSGQTLSGTVEGDLQADKDTVSNLTHLQAVYSGAPGSPFTFLGGISPGDLSLSGSKPFEFFGFVSFPDIPSNMGFKRDFGFFLSNELYPNAVTVGTFGTVDGIYDFPRFAVALEAESFAANRFSATATPLTTATPEPSSLTLLSLGLASFSGCIWRRRRTKRQAISVATAHE